MSILLLSLSCSTSEASRTNLPSTACSDSGDNLGLQAGIGVKGPILHSML